MKLIFPTIEMKQAALDFRREHFDHGEMIIYGGAGLCMTENYECWLQKINADVTYEADNVRVPATAYFAVVDDEIVGIIQIRHVLNDHLRYDGGHIGYGVRPSARHKGYATLMLAMALEKCRKLGISNALVVCEKENIGSVKTIIKNGGVFDSEYVDDDGIKSQRYWISTAPSPRA